MVSPVSSISPSAPKPVKKKSRPASPEVAAIKLSGKPDSLKKTKTAAIRFGDPAPTPAKDNGFFSKLKKVGLGTLGALSTGGFLLVGLPLGLAQMALGIFLHPLLITGALTMAIPLAGVAASFFLWPDKK